MYLIVASYNPKGAVAFLHGPWFTVRKEAAANSENERGEQDAGKTNDDSKFDKDERKIDGSVARSTYSVYAPV